MPSVRCPECGEHVKYRVDDVKLRCLKCGEKFRAPHDDDEEEQRPRKKKTPAKKSSNKVVVTAILGGLVGIALIALVVVLLVRGNGQDGSGGEGQFAEVSAESYKKVHSAMTLEEVETILGRGGKSSDQDMKKAFVRTEGPFKGKLVWGQDPTPPDRAMEWRRWDAKNNIRIWVAFLNTKHGPLSAFGVFVEPSGNGGRNVNTFTNLGEGLEKRLEDTYSARMQTVEIRKDAKWVRGAKGQSLVLGDWRNEVCEGMLIEAAGKLRTRDDVPQPKDPNRLPIYRFLNDNQLEITLRLYGDSRVSVYDFFVFQDELVLIDVTPNSPHNKALFYYRMPPRPGNLADTKILQTLIVDMKSSDHNKLRDASGKFVRLGKHGLPALRELERTNPVPLKSHIQRTIKAAEARAKEENN
jgi:hypothetical protein